MGRWYWIEMPPEVRNARTVDSAMWWIVRNYDSEWEAKRALLDWALHRDVYVPELKVRSVMQAVRYKRFHRIRI